MSRAEAWITSGAASLTGLADGPGLIPPDGALDRIAALGDAVGVDPFATLTERAAIASLRRQGQVSCGGGTRLLRTRDDWVALSLVRPHDHESVPAWLDRDLAGWEQIAGEVATRPTSELIDRGLSLDLAIARLSPPTPPEEPVATVRLGERRRTPRDRPLVVDLSSLWAGPLAARVLGDHGTDVVKVESTERPDGARRGPSAFYDRLHAGHRSVAVDLSADAGLHRLRELVRAADVVIEASRPRALEQLGVVTEDPDANGPAVWISITGHGRAGAHRNRVAFGDDAAVAGGLVAPSGVGPVFVADAVADPLTGLAVAGEALRLLDSPGRWLIDAALARTAAWVAAEAWNLEWQRVADPPPPRREVGGDAAPPIGAHTSEVLEEMGIA